MNKVLVIGVDHHNTLAAIRCFGRKNVEMEILVHENIEQLKKVKISHSKYAKNIYLVKNDEKSIFNWLIMHKEDEKILIVPCSDLAEYTIDKHYKDLSNFYIIPGFKNNNGKICKMMDKYEQKKWADKNKIPMAKSWSVKRKNNSFKIPDDIVYPCIIKPQISALGMKSDIVKANSENELKKILDEKINNGYDEIFIQEFLNKKFEILAQGCIVDESPNFFGGVTKKLMVRMPPGGGSTVLGQYISGKKIVDKVKKVLVILYKEGYRGLYDIEFLVCKDDIYLIEINFRHSGQGYSLLNNGINAPYIWYLSTLKQKYDENIKLLHPDGYFFDETEFLRLLAKKKVSLKKFIEYVKRSYIAAKFDKNDFSGTWAFYKDFLFSRLKNKLKRKKTNECKE